jgi:hypothetical protein
MKKLMVLSPLLLTACINMSSTAGPVEWSDTDKAKWALELLDIKKQTNECYYHLKDEEFDQFNINCDAYVLGARLNDVIIEFETHKSQFPDLADTAFIIKEFAADIDVAMQLANDYRAVDHMKGFIVSFELANVIINH